MWRAFRACDEVRRGRSLAEEQVGVYEAVAQKLHTQFGLDGRACVLRFICELQQRRLGHSTVAGKVLTALFTYKILRNPVTPAEKLRREDGSNRRKKKEK
ncbi:uncharacterized protein LOC123502769 isoform X2 [Portunus trituberculatus]|uniref:uncharacterized protein LOC123502769 isoform X2 n=1 Tax=Portunus trituberculatus TaxID=210409 RepID=UPI001E1D0875|nr:uncharacterized protein LOC123502769 isoform X2 [Portunus trituberculatus]